MLPYSKQSIDQSDIDIVAEVLQSSWLTTGPWVGKFEQAIAEYVASDCAVSFSNGTAALHAAVNAVQCQPDDEVIVPAISFVATANAAVYCGATPVFADVDPNTLLIDPADVVRKISSRTKAIIAMDYGGQPCDYPVLRQIANQHDVVLISDACHSIGATSYGRHVAQWADMTCFSFHPVKPLTTCEGGMVVTDNSAFDKCLRQFRNHGIDTDHHQRAKNGTFAYDMSSLGFNYRLSDVHSALGWSQLRKLPVWQEQRNEVAKQYHQQLANQTFCQPLERTESTTHAWHLFAIRWNEQETGVSRDEVVTQLRERGIYANVHYLPIYQHSFYQNHERVGLRLHRCPNAEAAYPQLISLPIFPSMTSEDVSFVVKQLSEVSKLASLRRQVA